MNQKSNKIVFLDGLRGYAVLLVMTFHYLGSLQLFKFGWIGVNLFFVISGFLITKLLLASKASQFYYKNFLKRRALRILPLYYLCIFFVFVIFPNISFLSELVNEDHQIWFWFYSSNFLFVKSSLAHTDSIHILGHFWSLAIEEQFYLVWPIFVLLLGRKSLVFFSLILIVTSLLLRWTAESNSAAFISTFHRMDGLCLGAIIAIAFTYWFDSIRKYSELFLIASILSIVTLLTLYTNDKSALSALHPTSDINIKYGIILIDIACSAMLAYLLFNGKFSSSIKKIFQYNFIVKIGKYSYGLYVYHMIVLSFNYALFNYLGIFENNTKLLYLTVLMSSIFGTIIISYISYNYFESYFLTLKDIITNKENQKHISTQKQHEPINLSSVTNLDTER